MVDGMKWKFLSFFILKRGEKVPCCKSQISDMKRKKNLLIWVSVLGDSLKIVVLTTILKSLIWFWAIVFSTMGLVLCLSQMRLLFVGSNWTYVYFFEKILIYRKYNDFDPQITSIQHEHSFQMPYY